MKTISKMLKVNKFIERHPICILFIVSLILFHKVILNPTHIVYSPISDTIDQWSYYSYLISDTYGKYNEIPLWNPYTLSGYSFVGNLFSAMFYPFNIPLLFLNPDTADAFFGFNFFLHYFLGSVFMLLFLRKINISKFGSLVGSLVYLLSSRFALVVWAGHPSTIPMIMLLPLIFLLVEIFFEKKNLASALYISIVLSVLLLGTHPQFFLYTVFILSFYFIFKTIILIKEKGKNVSKLIFYIAVMFILVLPLSSIQLLPSLEFSKNNIRTGGVDFEFASNISYEPWNFVTIFIPNFFGSYLDNTYWGTYAYWQKALYIGILPLIFAFFSLFNLKNKYVPFFLSVLIFSLLFAMGKYSPVFYIFSKLPLFNLFRVPARMLIFFNFSMIILAAFGIDFLYNEKWKLTKSRVLKNITKIFSIFSAIILLVTLGLFLFKSVILELGRKILNSKFDTDQVGLNSYDFYLSKIEPVYNGILNGWILLSIFFVLGTFIVIYLIKNKTNKYLKPVIILLIFLDLGLYSIAYIDVKDSKEVFSPNKLTEFLTEDKGYFRVLDTTIELLPQKLTIRNSIYKVNGYEAMFSFDYQKYTSKASDTELLPATTLPLKRIEVPSMYDLLNVKYVISSKPLENEQYNLINTINTFTYISNGVYFIYDKKIQDDNFEFISEQDTFLYENLNVFPRAYLVPNAIVIYSRDEALDMLTENKLDSKNTLILEKDPNKPLINKGSYKEVGINFYSPNEVIINVNVDNSSFLVLSDTFDDGWKAYDNDKEIEIYRANYILRSVYLEKGTHELIFRYEPKGYKIGKSISIITFNFLLILLLSMFLFNMYIKNTNFKIGMK